MEPLREIKKVFKWVCGVPPDESDSNRDKIQYILLTICVITIHSLAVISGAIFIYRHVSVDLEQALFSLFHTIGSLQSLYQSIATIVLRRKLIAILKNLANIYDENKNGDWFHLLKQTNEKCEWIWPIYLKYFMGCFIVITITIAAVSVGFSYFAYGHFEAEHLYHPLKLTFPWNQTNLPGYPIEICFNIATGEVYFLSNGSLLILFISMCLHHQTFYEMFCNEASKLNYRDKDRNDAEHLCKMIRFHISVKDWFLDSAKTYSTFVLIVLITSMLFLACCVFQLDLQMKHPGFGLYVISLAIATGLLNLFAYCYCGKIATESYEQMANCLYDCNWREIDPKLRKYFIVMLANTQRPIYYHGFGVAILNLETFTNMIRAVYTYYMIFKTLTSD